MRTISAKAVATRSAKAAADSAAAVPAARLVPLPKGVSITEVVEHCAESGGWQKTTQGWQRRKDLTQPYQDPHLKRGVGFACAFKNVGFSFGAPENCWATVELHGGVELRTAIAADRVQHVARQTRGVHADQHVLPA